MEQYVLDTTNVISPQVVTSNHPPNVNEHYSGLIRYAGTPQLAWKNIDPTEQAVYNDAKLPVAHVFEVGGVTALNGRDEGRRNADSMLADLSHCRANALAAHFVAQDQDYSGVNWRSAVASYFRGLHEECDPHLLTVSGYGGYDVIKFLFDEGLIEIGWQTKAWSHGLRDHRAAIYQQVGYVNPGGIQCDWNIVYAPNWGQNMLGDIGPMANMTDEEVRRLNLAVNQILGSAIPGQVDFKGSLASISNRINTLSALVKSDDEGIASLFTDGKTAILTAVAGVDGSSWSEADKAKFAVQISEAIAAKGIEINPNTILDALKLRLES